MGNKNTFGPCLPSIHGRCPDFGILSLSFCKDAGDAFANGISHGFYAQIYLLRLLSFFEYF